jgi:uncharacterized membrane protein
MVGRMTIAAVVAAIGMMGPLAGGVAGASPPTITTPFPSVSVQPGTSISLKIEVSAASSERVDLGLSGVPAGWQASLSGGGNEVQSVTAGPSPTELTLDVRLPADAADGVTRLMIIGTVAGGGRSSIPVDLRVTKTAGGTVRLTSDFPSLRGTSTQKFTFSLQLANDTPQQLTFALTAQGPSGWEVTAEPTGQAAAASVAVDARGTKALTVTATPPSDVTAGTYPLVVGAASGTQSAQLQLSVEVTGKVAMALVTPDQRLNTTATAGAAHDFAVVVENTGSAPLQAVALSGTGPTDWTVTFDPPSIEAVPAGRSTTATAHITPSADAIAGDYMVTLKATSGDTTSSIDIRVTVETPPIWGIVGLLLILGTLGGMVWVFRRYGRR